jgi:hypothetical protein
VMNPNMLAQVYNSIACLSFKIYNEN